MFYFSPLGLWCSILVFLAYRYRPTFRYWVFYSLGLGSFFHYHLGFSWALLGSSILGFSFLCSSNTCSPTYYLTIPYLVAYTLRLFLYVLLSAVSFNMRSLF